MANLFCNSYVNSKQSIYVLYDLMIIEISMRTIGENLKKQW